jgi:predicted nucleic acid-binding protein
MEPVVVDANILFSALLRQETTFSRHLLTSERRFFICESTVVELFKHSARICRLRAPNRNRPGLRAAASFRLLRCAASL